MKLYVIDFDGTLFRSPVPHPSLGEDWVEWIQGATVEGQGLGFFQEPGTLTDDAGVKPRPDSDDYIASTVQIARDAYAAGHHVVVMTGRSDYFVPRIKEILAHGNIPHHGVFAKEQLFHGTVRFKSKAVADLVELLNAQLFKKSQQHAMDMAKRPEAFPDLLGGGGGEKSEQQQQQQLPPPPPAPPSCLESVIIYDDRPEQMSKYVAKIRELCPRTRVEENLVDAPLRFVPTAQLENRLLWKIFSAIKSRVGEPKVISLLLPSADNASSSAQPVVKDRVADPMSFFLHTLKKHEHLHSVAAVL